MDTGYEIVPVGKDATNPSPGDFILCHRRGVASAFIRWGERIKFRGGSRWSHAAFIETPTTIIEALTKGVVRNLLSDYRNIEYILVRTNLDDQDLAQALAYVRHRLGMRYGFLTDLGIALRFMTPGRGLWFGMTGSEICSGLVAQALVRGWKLFDINPSAISPAELAESYGIPAGTSSQTKI